MEHITVIEKDNGYYHLTPDEGYVLCHIERNGSKSYYPDAEVKETEVGRWSAVPL